MRKITALVVGLLLACASTAAAGEFAYADDVYAELDPARIRLRQDERLVLALFEPLTAIDPRTGAVVPAAAERWDVAPDGRTWTFHIRPGATWSDGKPLRAQDFVDAWRRALDPYEPSPWVWAFRPIDGCAEIADSTAALDAVAYVRSRLGDLVDEKREGTIPGGEVRALLARSGLARHLAYLEDAGVRAFASAEGGDLAVDEARALLDGLKEERRRLKKEARRALDAFGTAKGATPQGEKTLVVRLARPCPWLGDLLARGVFAPLAPATVRGSESAFLPGELVSNGPFVLKGRGAKPHASVPNPLSVVHLVRNDKYDGPHKARADEVFCFTGQGAKEDLRRVRAGELQWLPNPSPAVRKEAEALTGFGTHPGSDVLVLRFRCDRPPFDSVEVRRAFCDALRDAPLAGACWPEADVARGLVPPTVRRDGVAAPPWRGGAEAKAALKTAGLAGDAFPWLELRYAERGADEELADRLVEAWKASLGVELGLRIEAPAELDASIRAGAYEIAVDRVEGLVNDAEPFVAAFADADGRGGTGWADPVFEALVAAARDPAALLAGGEAALEPLKGVETVARAAAAARGGDASRALEALRRACLEAAETRLLEAYVVVPLVIPKRAFVLRGGKGIGEDAAWRHPAFLGALWSAESP